MDYKKLVPVKVLAEHLGCSESTVRNAVKKGKIPGTHFILERWGFELELAGKWEVPPRRAFGRTREDGRYLCKIWCTPEEMETLAGQGFDVSRKNPSKPKAKKQTPVEKAQAGYTGAAAMTMTKAGLEQQEAPTEDEDPFASFGA